MRHHGIDPEGKLEFFFVEPKPRPYMEPAFQWGKQIMPETVERQVEATIRRLKGSL